jgi:glutathione peroxidase
MVAAVGLTAIAHSSPALCDAVLDPALLAAAVAPVAAVATSTAGASAPLLQLAAAAGAECPPLLRHTFNRLQTGEPQSLCQFQGKVLLIVNTASYCGYTHQYEGLEAMYRKYRERGLAVVGFPANDFGGQEPGSNKEIAEFCRTTYGVQFPMFEKAQGSTLAANPLYAELGKSTGSRPQWNFHKYVVDRSGKPVASFKSDVEPDNRELTALIERLLAERPTGGKG